MRCDICAGACCESFALPLSAALPTDRDDDELQDINTWIILHADIHDGMLVFECRCKMLNVKDGTCLVYEERPNVCRQYEAGGPACLETVNRRRSADDYQSIRENGYPEVL